MNLNLDLNDSDPISPDMTLLDVADKLVNRFMNGGGSAASFQIGVVADGGEVKGRKLVISVAMQVEAHDEWPPDMLPGSGGTVSH